MAKTVQSEGEEGEVKKAIHRVGSSGKYQIFLILLMCIVWTQITFSGMINSYVFMNPVFKCNGKITPEIQACKKLKKCEYVNDYTATFQDDLYCKNKHQRSMIQSIYSVGCFIGLIGMSMLSDMKGRKFTFLLSASVGVLGCLSIMLGGTLKNYKLLMIGQVLQGISGSSFPIITYTFTGEVCSSKLRQKSIMLYCVIWGLSQMLFLVIYDYIKQWENYLWFMIVPGVLIFLIAFFILDESPSFWLLNQHNMEKFKNSIRYIGKFNGKSEADIQEAYQMVEHYKATKKLSMREQLEGLLGERKYFLIMVCLTSAQIGFNTFYYGVLSSLEKIGFTFSFNVFLIGLHEFVGYGVASYFVPSMRRKSSLIVVNICTSLIGLSFISDYVIGNQNIQSVCLSLSTLGFVLSYSFISMINTQSFPNQVQSTAMGLCSGVSQIGRFMAPFIITYMNDINLHPFVGVSGVLLVFGVFPIFLIPQTLKKQKTQ